ncbi:MAG: thiamine phosphate synthase [Chloroherpetonaceae bacterium]|nr:thiamine phosphate synthase [Chloroherpetonaceae bacterium]
MKLEIKKGGICVITDSLIQNRFTHEKLAELAIKGGASLIQLREKQKSDADLFEIAQKVKVVCNRFKIPFIINDRVDIALLSGADGVHLGQNDLPIVVARKILGENKIIGGSAGSLAEAKQVERDGADYIGIGHIYHTSTKEKLSEPLGLEKLKEITSQISIPIFAIGGINHKNIKPVFLAGASVVAVISCVVSAENPELAMKELISSCV